MIEIKHRSTGVVLLEVAAGSLQEATLAGRNLREAALGAANLQRANLRGTNLQWADLHSSRLDGADLQQADLRCAWLRDASLTHADLRGANLQHARLLHADLSNADLRGAKLRDPDRPLFWDLKDTDLRGADLRDAEIDGTIFPFVQYDHRTRWPAGLDPREHPIVRWRGAEGTGATVLFAAWESRRVQPAMDWLERDGYRTGLVASGVEALAWIRQEPPDVLVTEAMLPLIDGFELVSQLRTLQLDHRIPVVMLVAPPTEVGGHYPAPEPPIVRWIIHQASAEEMLRQITRGVRGALAEDGRDED